MAIARDNAAKIGAATGSTGLSGAYTCTGTNLVLLAFAERDNANVQTCTYNSVSMTLVGSFAYNVGSGGRFMDVFILAAPATGSNTLASSGTGSTYRALFGMSYTGVNQVSTADNSNSNSTSGVSSLTVSLTPVASNCWIVGMAMDDNGGTMTATNSSVINGSASANPGGANIMFDTNGTASGSTTMGASSTVAGGFGIAVVSIAPVSATTTAYPKLMLNGYGYA